MLRQPWRFLVRAFQWIADLTGIPGYFRHRKLKRLILLILKDDELTGFHIRIRLETLGVGKVGEASIYPLLHVLERDGRIKGRWEDDQELTTRLPTTEGEKPIQKKLYSLAASPPDDTSQ